MGSSSLAQRLEGTYKSLDQSWELRGEITREWKQAFGLPWLQLKGGRSEALVTRNVHTNSSNLARFHLDSKVSIGFSSETSLDFRLDASDNFRNFSAEVSFSMGSKGVRELISTVARSPSPATLAAFDALNVHQVTLAVSSISFISPSRKVDTLTGSERIYAPGVTIVARATFAQARSETLLGKAAKGFEEATFFLYGGFGARGLCSSWRG